MRGDDGWDSSGMPLRLPNIDNAGNARLIAKAQPQFIASGASIQHRGAGTGYTPNVEDAPAVKRRLADFGTTLGEYLGNFDHT